MVRPPMGAGKAANLGGIGLLVGYLVGVQKPQSAEEMLCSSASPHAALTGVDVMGAH